MGPSWKIKWVIIRLGAVSRANLSPESRLSFPSPFFKECNDGVNQKSGNQMNHAKQKKEIWENQKKIVPIKKEKDIQKCLTGGNREESANETLKNWINL